MLMLSSSCYVSTANVCVDSCEATIICNPPCLVFTCVKPAGDMQGPRVSPSLVQGLVSFSSVLVEVMDLTVPVVTSVLRWSFVYCLCSGLMAVNMLVS